MSGKSKCAKRRYETRAVAEDMLLTTKISAGLRGRKRRAERRAYYCDRCKGFHLTSQPPKTVGRLRVHQGVIR